MVIKEEQQQGYSLLTGHILSFVNKLDSFNSKQDVVHSLLEVLSHTFNIQFLSFVEKINDSIQVLCQIGDAESIKNIFNENVSSKIFAWVIDQQQPASLKLGEKNNFIFIPVYDYIQGRKIVHGLVVMYLADYSFNLSKETSKNIKLLSKLSAVSMTRFSLKKDISEPEELEQKNQLESEYLLQIQNILSGSSGNKKILFSVLEDKEAAYNGNFWWISELGAEITLVLIAQADDVHGDKTKFCGSPLAILSGYIMGEMNSLKTKAEISLNPAKVMKYLNEELNDLFKSTGITFNAWYGVFNLEARKVRYSNANHSDPFLIGPEQQISNLVVGNNKKDNPLGLNVNSEYEESVSYISSKSKLVICTSGLVEQAAKIGHKYDPSWLPQVLETIGTLPLKEMSKNLQSILSENVSGTAPKSSRLALLLEMPS